MVRPSFAFFVALLALFSLPASALRLFTSTRMTVVAQGSGPDVILIPGLTSNPRVWGPAVAAVPGYRYHLVHIAGFSGALARGNATGPVAAPVAEEIARYIAEQHLAHPAVVGHSMGGSIGIMLAARHPALVGKLMIVDEMPFMGIILGLPNPTPDSVRPIADKMRDQILATPTGAAADQYKATVTQMIAGMTRTQAARPALVNDSESSDHGVVAEAFHELLLTDLRPELPRITVPTTVLYVTPARTGMTDAQIDSGYRAAYGQLAGVKFVRIPDSAHFIMIDQPVRFQEELRAFLKP